jgi:plastocyanin
MLNRPTLLTTCLIAALLTSPAGATRRPHTYRVSMKSFAYSPSSLTVHVGDRVRWTYDETALDVPPGCESPAFRTPVASCPGHSVTSTTKRHGRPLFDSGVHRAAGFPFTVRFTVAGTFTYFCTVHGGPHPNNPVTHMDGTVIVRK